MQRWNSQSLVDEDEDADVEDTPSTTRFSAWFDWNIESGPAGHAKVVRRLHFAWIGIEVLLGVLLQLAYWENKSSAQTTLTWIILMIALVLMVVVRLTWLVVSRWCAALDRQGWNTALFVFDYVAITCLLIPEIYAFKYQEAHHCDTEYNVRTRNVTWSRLLQLVLWYQVTFLVPRSYIGVVMFTLWAVTSAISLLACVWLEGSMRTNIAFEATDMTLLAVEMAACYVSKIHLHKFQEASLFKMRKMAADLSWSLRSLESQREIQVHADVDGIEMRRFSGRVASTVPQTIPAIERVADFSEFFFTAKDLERQLDKYADEDGIGGLGYKDVLLGVFSLLSRELKSVKGAAALFVIAPYPSLNQLHTEPVDGGKSSRECFDLTVFQPSFRNWLVEFSEHHEGDRGKDGLPTDGGIAVSHRSGRVMAAAVKFLVGPGPFRMKNHGTRHTAAADVAAHLRSLQSDSYPPRPAGATLVRSENGTVSVFPAASQHEGVVWRVRA